LTNGEEYDIKGVYQKIIERSRNYQEFGRESMKDTKEDGKGIVASIYFDPLVWSKLNEQVISMQRSRSWIVNFILREPLGIPQEQPKSTVTKL